jgi:hypothetical protein
MSKRAAFFRACDANTLHQRRAGLASWAAFSARWRARQGLPLLHPMDVQYLTPDDFRNSLGRGLAPAEQRRRFRAYVQAAIEVGCAWAAQVAAARQAGLVSSDLAYVRADGFQRVLGRYRDYVYGGRDDVEWYEAEALSPTRPYGIPLTSDTFPAYWLDASTLDDEEENW